MNRTKNAFIMQLMCFGVGIIMTISGSYDRADTWFVGSVVIGALVTLYHIPKDNN